MGLERARVFLGMKREEVESGPPPKYRVFPGATPQGAWAVRPSSGRARPFRPAPPPTRAPSGSTRGGRGARPTSFPSPAPLAPAERARAGAAAQARGTAGAGGAGPGASMMEERAAAAVAAAAALLLPPSAGLRRGPRPDGGGPGLRPRPGARPGCQGGGGGGGQPGSRSGLEPLEPARSGTLSSTSGRASKRRRPAGRPSAPSCR